MTVMEGVEKSVASSVSASETPASRINDECDGTLTGSTDGPPCAVFLGVFHGLGYGGRVTGNHNLSRRVEIDRLGYADRGCFVAQLDDLVVIESEYSGHRADTDRHRFLHQLRAALDDTHCIDEVDRARANQCRVLAEAVSGHLRRRRTARLLPDLKGRHAGGKHGRLCHDRLAKALRGPALYQLPQVIAQHVTGGGVSLLHDRILGGEIGLHALRLRALPGEYHSDRQFSLLAQPA